MMKRQTTTKASNVKSQNSIMKKMMTVCTDRFTLGSKIHESVCFFEKFMKTRVSLRNPPLIILDCLHF